MAITKHLHDCIEKLPRGRWFTLDDITATMRRRYWVCQRLVEEKVLEKKIEGEGRHFTGTLYFRFRDENSPLLAAEKVDAAVGFLNRIDAIKKPLDIIPAACIHSTTTSTEGTI